MKRRRYTFSQYFFFNHQTTQVIRKIAESEKIRISDTVLTRIAEKSRGNLRNAILTFETMIMQQLIYLSEIFLSNVKISILKKNHACIH